MIKIDLGILNLLDWLVDGVGASAATFADILDTNLSSLGLHFLSLTSSMSVSSSVSVKEVQGVLTGPTSTAVKLVLSNGINSRGVEQFGIVEQLTVEGIERLVSRVWVGLVGVIVWNTSSRLSSSCSLGELKMLAMEDTS